MTPIPRRPLGPIKSIWGLALATFFVVLSTVSTVASANDDLQAYFKEILAEYLQQGGMTELPFEPNLFNHAELQNVSANTFREWEQFEAQLQPRILYHWASDYEVEQLRHGLLPWLQTSKFFWRSPLGTFMYGENRLEKGIAKGGGANLIRVKLKADVTFIDAKEYVPSFERLAPHQAVFRHDKLVPLYHMKDFTRDSLLSFFEYYLPSTNGRADENLIGRAELLLDSIESVSVNHSEVAQEASRELKFFEQGQQLGIPHFDSYIRLNGIPELVSPVKDGVQSYMKVDGHVFDKATLYERVRSLLNRVRSKKNSILLYGPNVDPALHPHFAPQDLEQQLFSPHAILNAAPNPYQPNSVCTNLLKPGSRSPK